VDQHEIGPGRALARLHTKTAVRVLSLQGTRDLATAPAWQLSPLVIIAALLAAMRNSQVWNWHWPLNVSTWRIT